MSDDQFDLKSYEKRMHGALNALKADLVGLRTDRASTAALEPVVVNAYGANMPLNQVATISVQDARMAVVQVWDGGLVNAVDKAIRDANIGLNPMAEGNVLRIPFPAMTSDRRQEIVKIAGKYAEQSRIAVRNVRRDGMDQLKKLEKTSGITEDEHHRYNDQLQKLTDRFVADIEQALSSKERDITTI